MANVILLLWVPKQHRQVCVWLCAAEFAVGRCVLFFPWLRRRHTVSVGIFPFVRSFPMRRRCFQVI